MNWDVSARFLVTAALTWMALDVEAQDTASPNVALNAICKKDSMPAGYVAVHEFYSSQCEAKNAFELNAWDLDKPRDGIVACALPDYLSGYPPAMAFVPKRRVVSDQCAPHIDGGPNAFELRLPTHVSRAFDYFEDADFNETKISDFAPFCWRCVSHSRQYLHKNL